MTECSDNAACLIDKLTVFLSRISRGETDGIHELFLEQLLSSISKVFESKTANFAPVLTWFEENTKHFPTFNRNPTILSFLISLGGTIFKNEEYFVRGRLSDIDLKVLDREHAKNAVSSIRRSYLSALFNVISHNSGNLWIREKSVWEDAVHLAVSDLSLYVRREAFIFLKQFLKANCNEYELCKNIVETIFKPIAGQNLPEKDIPKVIMVMKLLDNLMDECVNVENGNLVPKILINEFAYDSLLRKWAEECLDEEFLNAIVASYGTLILTNLPNDNSNDVAKIMDLYRLLIKSKKLCAVFTFSRVNHALWIRLRTRRPNADKRTEMHFYVTQLLPLLVSLRYRENSPLLDQFVNKVLDRVSEETFRMAYAAKELIREEKLEKPVILVCKATRAVHGLMDLHSLMDRDAVVITFQTLAWSLKNFVPASCDVDLNPGEVEIMDARMLCESAAPLLSAILNGLCTLLQAYKINWNEAFEGLCLLKLCHWLLDNPNLSTKHVVMTLRVIQLNIAQCMAPSLVLLVDRIEGTSLEAVGPLLVKKFHDTQWEVRDSALEVVTVIADLAIEKYPAFVDLLLNLNCGSLAVAMLQGDAESYVRASAIKAIAAMVPVDRLWNESLASLDIARITENVLLNDTEAIVRRDAVLLLITLLRFRQTHSPDSFPHSQTMLFLILNDLHWEVRVNALTYWSDVIDIELERQGMVDGIFPPVTFARESKKIISLTRAEVQKRLNRALELLSIQGCLNALLSALFDDCDQEVVVKASQVVLKLVRLLRDYQLLPVGDPSMSKKRKCSPERKQRRNSATPSVNQNVQVPSADDVIDDIINSTDLKLLTNVVIVDSSPMEITDRETVPMIPADAFLVRLQDWELADDRVSNSADDLASILDDILLLDRKTDGDNFPDCY